MWVVWARSAWCGPGPVLSRVCWRGAGGAGPRGVGRVWCCCGGVGGVWVWPLVWVCSLVVACSCVGGGGGVVGVLAGGGVGVFGVLSGEGLDVIRFTWIGFDVVRVGG